MSVAVPGLTHYRPENPNGHAILLCQGGGYQRIGRVSLIPEWYQARGFHVFDLVYRLPFQGWAAGPDVPLEDAQQAMRKIKAWRNDLRISGKIGVMGFSSGGHVAGSLATRWDTPLAIGDDDQTSARPDFAILMCPVLTMIEDFTHEASRKRLFGEGPAPEELTLRSVEKQARPDMPPVCLIHASDDSVVPAEDSIEMFLAVKAQGVSAELHVPEIGGHRMSDCFRENTPLSAYAGLTLEWLSAQTDKEAS